MRVPCTMWKSLRSSVRDLLELRVGFTGRKKSHEPEMHGRLACLLPSRRSCCILRTWQGQSQRAAGGNQESQESGGKRKPEWNVPPPSIWAETFGWSTAVVVSWYLSHPFGQQLSQRRCGVWWQTLTGRTNPVALPILPIRASRSSVDSHSSISSFSSDSATTDGDQEWSNRRGPFTPLQALDEATREFAEISRKREANVENQVGVRYMNDGRHRLALRHFRKASLLDHDHAAYNVGQCYELGLGTQRNIRKAAKWYKIAAQRGHPTAMYNLGVFSAHGWGGMPPNQEEAHKYFSAASKLGHEEAQAALKMVETMKTADVSSEVTLHTAPTPTQVLLDMLGVSNDKKSNMAVNKTMSANSRSLHWLDLSLSSGSYSSKSGNKAEPRAWLGVADDMLVATCQNLLHTVQSRFSFENSPTTEAAL